MMDDTDNNDHMLFHAVVKAMLAVLQTVDAFAQLRLRHPDVRVREHQGKSFFKSQEIGVRCVGIKLCDAVFADFDKVGARRWA